MMKSIKKDSQVRLVMVMGLPGSGKSYLSRALAGKTGYLHINSDIVRKELSQKPAYSALEKQRIYQAMYGKVKEALLQGKTVIVDATFSLQAYREPYIEFVNKKGIPYRIILMVAGENTIESRLQQDRRDSDADYRVYKKIKKEYQPLRIPHLVLETDQVSLEQMIARSINFIESNGHERAPDS